MTKNNEQMIINGVDVSGCDELHINKANTIICEITGYLCDDRQNCYYKQLKRKEQECEELKEYKEDLTQRLCDMNAHKTFEIVELKQTLEKIREIIIKAQEENGLINISTILQKINEVIDDRN